MNGVFSLSKVKNRAKNNHYGLQPRLDHGFFKFFLRKNAAPRPDAAEADVEISTGYDLTKAKSRLPQAAKNPQPGEWSV